MVDRLLQPDEDEFNTKRLKVLGHKAVPALVKLLEDSKRVLRPFPKNDEALSVENAFERICELLASTSPPQAAGSLAFYIDHEDDGVRKHAALVLGSIGTADCIVPIVKALDDEDDYVRSYAMMGIERGIDGKRCTKEFLTAVFTPLTKLLNRDDDSTSRLLLAIDAPRAFPILLSPEYLTPENEKVHYILKALNGTVDKIPHEKLLPILSTVQPLSDKYPHNYEYAEA